MKKVFSIVVVLFLSLVCFASPVVDVNAGFGVSLQNCASVNNVGAKETLLVKVTEKNYFGVVGICFFQNIKNSGYVNVPSNTVYRGGFGYRFDFDNSKFNFELSAGYAALVRQHVVEHGGYASASLIYNFSKKYLFSFELCPLYTGKTFDVSCSLGLGAKI